MHIELPIVLFDEYLDMIQNVEEICGLLNELVGH